MGPEELDREDVIPRPYATKLLERVPWSGPGRMQPLIRIPETGFAQHGAEIRRASARCRADRVAQHLEAAVGDRTRASRFRGGSAHQRSAAKTASGLEPLISSISGEVFYP